MDYTDLARVKAALRATETADDAVLASLITAASRAIDRHCTGAPNSDDYFALADVTDEILFARVDAIGALALYPHKAIVNSVASVSYRFNPADDWLAANSDSWWNAGSMVQVHAGLTVRRLVQVKVSYNGGFGATVGALPADVVEACTVLAIRYYREAATGLTDSIGVAELGTLMYTKALPVRVIDLLRPYKRVVGW